VLKREDIKDGGQLYLLNGKRVWVFMIHKPGSGESVTLCDELPPGCDNPYHYIHLATMQMRKFQRTATLVPNLQH
jgi:hypothetical protein